MSQKVSPRGSYARGGQRDSETIYSRIPGELHRALQAQTWVEKRTMSAIVASAVEEYLERRGK